MSEPPLDREVRRRLAVLRQVVEVSGNVNWWTRTGRSVATCRYYGVTREAYYAWLRRFEAEGVDGLRDRSKRPKNSPNSTHPDVVGKLIHLRQNYHFGPGKIQINLQYHDVEISKSGVW